MRVLTEGRAKLADDGLYSYEAGALYEGKRNYPRAGQEYVKGSLAAGGESQAASRLLTLAPLPKFRDVVYLERQKTSGPSVSTMPDCRLLLRRLRLPRRQLVVRL